MAVQETRAISGEQRMPSISFSVPRGAQQCAPRVLGQVSPAATANGPDERHLRCGPRRRSLGVRAQETQRSHDEADPRWRDGRVGPENG